jgi:hypothetical protein
VTALVAKRWRELISAREGGHSVDAACEAAPVPRLSAAAAA